MMNRFTRALALGLGVGAVVVPHGFVVQADEVIVPDIAKKLEKVPNGGALPRLLGVDDETGEGELNAFGEAFKRSRYIWTTTLCEEDTDGDGQTNGQELGDPCCSWRETKNLAYLRVSNPSSNTSKVNPVMFANIECTKSEEAEAAEAEQEGKASARRSRTPTPSRTKKTRAADGSSETDSESVSDPAESGNVGRQAAQGVVQAMAVLVTLGTLIISARL
ncbi:hypothetical protein ATCC90586_000849 [Pythium insidiosum]|nr:hypothetical protein ATCC90586_000849 [Pythium insidiosum]